MKMFVLVLLAFGMVVGCSPHVPTLAEEVASHPDTWDRHWKWGASSNHWALLERVVAVDDVQERIRLVTALRERLRRTPEQMLADCGDLNVVKQRINFVGSCAWRLASSKGDDPAVLLAGWSLRASWLDDQERLMDLTENYWNGGDRGGHRNFSQQDWCFRELAFWVRRNYELYFKYNFNLASSLRKVPESARPAFVEQIKRDFFHRRGMKYVDMNKIPPEFK